MKIISLALTVAFLTLSTVASADPVGGAKNFSDRLGRNMKATYDLVLRDGEETLIAVVGDHASDLDCFLYDENGNMVEKDDDSTDVCHIAITPRWAGHFKLEVRNVGARASSYRGHAL